MLDEKMKVQKNIFILHDMLSKMTSLKASIRSGMNDGVDRQFFLSTLNSAHQIEQVTKSYLASQEDHYSRLGGHFHVPSHSQKFHSIN